MGQIAALAARWSNMSIDWEHVLLAQYEALPRFRTVIDIGAHKGYHTHRFAARANQVVAFEPIPTLAEDLARVFAGTNVQVNACALSTTEGVTTFAWNRKVPSESGLKQRQGATDTSDIVEIEVRLRRLDAFGLTEVDFVKSDCEGADLQALKGGLETLKANRPLVSIEYGAAGYRVYGFSQGSILEFADSIGYRLTDLFGNIVDSFNISRVVDVYYWDYFLVPEERSDLLMALATNGERLTAGFDRFVPRPSLDEPGARMNSLA